MQSILNQRENCGRKKIITNRENGRLSLQVLTNWIETRQHMSENINAVHNIPISKRMFQRELHYMYTWSKVPWKSPMLTISYKKARLQYDKLLKNWILEEYKRIIWFNESRFASTVNHEPFIAGRLQFFMNCV